MYLTLFVLLMVLSLVLIALGFIIREHAELSLIGFAFLFLLSFLLMGNDIQIQTGVNLTNTFGEYNSSVNTSTFHITSVEETKTYEDIKLGGTYSHTFGYWLIIISVLGFIGVLFGLKKQEGF